ncbi:MAG: aldehyde reductase [Alphaproteobacteria bacterium]|nr:aldehyde reductase [Alphaproteobacteria bacterium]
MSKGVVLVTGGSGYIAGFCIRQLLDEDWTVRATVRRLSREGEVRAAIGGAALDPERLSFFAAELMNDSGWMDALAGADYVLHVASPIPPEQPKNDQELIAPAREGTLRVLRFARAAGVKRVVVTSSTAAVTYGHDEPRPPIFNETYWTNPDHEDTNPYIRSKAIAERAAWDWLAKEGGSLQMATVNPGAVIGPVMGSDFSASIEIVKKLLEGSLPGLPRFGFPLVDVRDIADLHLRAMTHPAATGERFLGAGEFFWMREVASVLREELGPMARKAPKNELPNWVLLLAARFDPVVSSVVFELGKERKVDPTKAKTVLGWRPRPHRDSIIDCAKSLLEQGLVKGLPAA